MPCTAWMRSPGAVIENLSTCGLRLCQSPGIVDADACTGRRQVQSAVGGQAEGFCGAKDRTAVGVADEGDGDRLCGPCVDVLAERDQPRRHVQRVARVGGIDDTGDRVAAAEMVRPGR